MDKEVGLTIGQGGVIEQAMCVLVMGDVRPKAGQVSVIQVQDEYGKVQLDIPWQEGQTVLDALLAWQASG